MKVWYTSECQGNYWKKITSVKQNLLGKTGRNCCTVLVMSRVENGMKNKDDSITKPCLLL